MNTGATDVDKDDDDVKKKKGWSLSTGIRLVIYEFGALNFC